MKYFELIDDYLTNRLGETEKLAFENELQSNPDLRKEVAFQKLVIEGVKKARATELKSMLNNVPIGKIVSLEWVYALKIAASLVGAGLLAAGLSYYFHVQDNLNPASLSSSIEESIKNSDSLHASEGPKNTVETREKAVINEPDKGTDTEVSLSKRVVEVTATERKYSFHYQFAQGKLRLYGDFDSDSYKIIEVSSKNQLFMYHNGLYYLLDEKQTAITQLEPLKDKSLLSKLSRLELN
ncbi:MAG: hypothetical protein ACKO96_04570 [Flammeovirgaceae bacterium]